MPEILNQTHVNAPPEAVYRVAKDVERFPDFMPDVRSLVIVERSEDGSRQVSEWVGLIPEFKLTVKWTEEDLWDDTERTCTFRQLKGDFKTYEGMWRFNSQDGGTLFESVVRYEIEIPLVGPLIQGVVKKKMSDNVQRLQLALKKRVEEG